MTSNCALTRPQDHLQGSARETDVDEDVQFTLNDFSARTRGQASAMKRFAVEAGLLMPEKRTKPQAASGSEKSDTESEDDAFAHVPHLQNPWEGISKQSTRQAWLVWDNEQGEHQATHDSFPFD